MRITIERLGGFAGLRLRKTIDTHTLPAAEARRLKRLVSEAGFFDQPASITSPKRYPDRFQYTLHIEDGANAHTVVIQEDAVSPAMRKLITHLTAAAREEP